MDKDLQIVGFRIGRETFGLPIAIVREIVRVPEITSVPNAPDYIEGVINLRGRIIPVVDLRKRFGEKDVRARQEEPHRGGRDGDSRRIGLIVNSASEVLRIPPVRNRRAAQRFQGRRTQLHHRGRQAEGAPGHSAGSEPDSAAWRASSASRTSRSPLRPFPWAAPSEVSRPAQEHYRGTNVHHTLTTQVPLTEAELKLLQTLVYQECGMYFDERRTHFLRDRLQRRLKACQMDSFYSYYRLLTSREGKKELTALLENLTVNETSFFRIRPQLELFQKVILEEILKRKQERRDWSLRIWSAGCSTGQEPYTLAILVCDALAYYYLRNPLPFEMPTPKPLIPPPWKVEIVASDINYSRCSPRSRACTAKLRWKRGLHLPPALFRKVGDKYAVKPALKNLVQFDFHNLKTEYLPQHNDVIFCRNVMIYFDEAEQKRLIEKFHRCLNPEGYLFVGHAESLFGLTTKFHMIHENNATVYQRIEGAQ